MSTRQFKKKVYENPNREDRFFNLIFPQQALGSYVDDEAKESGFILTTLIVSLAICGILTTLTHLDVLNQAAVAQKTKNETLIATVFSWTLAVSFLFLLFGATKLFHICLLVGLVVTSALSIGGLQQSTDKNMLIAATVFASVSLAILFYYLTLSRTVTDSIEYREKERLARLEGKYKDRIERSRETADENIKFVIQQRDIFRAALEKTAKEKEELEKKLLKRRVERDKFKKVARDMVKKGYHDTDSESE